MIVYKSYNTNTNPSVSQKVTFGGLDGMCTVHVPDYSTIPDVSATLGLLRPVDRNTKAMLTFDTIMAQP